MVVPTYDERTNLERLLPAILTAVPEARVLVVDDASPDGTGEIAASFAARDPRVAVLHRPAKLGLGTAYVEGFRWALEREFDLVGQMDADLSHDPRDLPRLRDALDDADVALGSRNVPFGGVLGWGLGRHILSKGGSLYARSLLHTHVRDMTTGFKLYRAAALRAITPETLRSNGYAFQIESTMRALDRGLRVAEVPIVFCDRRTGHSKMSYRIVAEAVTGVIRMAISRERSAPVD